MQRFWPRLVLALIAAAVTATAGKAFAATPQPPRIQAFSLADVQLASASEFAANHEQNNEYLLMLDPNDLLFNFRTTAGLPAPGESLGGWEWRESEVRGQFIGHFLSAVAFAAHSTGRPEFQERGALMVRELKRVQDAHGNGYLSAFPESHFDRLEALEAVWAPYYVIHKLMAGLLDQHQMGGQGEALKMVELMAAYFCGRVRHVLAVNGTDHWLQVLDTEFGGMNEALYNLYSLTQDPAHAECAHWFDKPSFYVPLVEGRDPLPGLHANTHLAQVHGFTARYEQLGDADALAAAVNFFGLLLQHHSFSTGGSSWYEHWGSEDALGDAINQMDASLTTEESCTQYNVLKLARRLFLHTGDPALADFYERAILNGVIGIQKMRQPGSHTHAHQQQHTHGHTHVLPASQLAGLARPHNRMAPEPHDAVWGATARDEEQLGGPGVFIYYQPLGAGVTKGGSRFGWGNPHNSFWCCYGTAIESFSKLADSIYFKHTPDDWEAAAAAAGAASSHGAASSRQSGSAGGSKGEVGEHPRPSSSSGSERDPLPRADYPMPQIWVNQLVSSSVRWRELRVVVHQEADLYGPDTAALARLRIDIYPWDAGQPQDLPSSAPAHPKSGSQEKESRRFVLNWRIPGWAKASEIELRINGQNATQCLQQHDAAGAAAAGARDAGGGAPPFGAAARFCSLFRTWSNGDTLEAVMPMRVVAEPLNDARKELAGLRAIMMGPLLMAGLTDGKRDVDFDPSRIEQALSLPDTQGLVSLAAAGEDGAPPALVRLHSGGVQLSGGGAALDATFRLVAPLAGCLDDDATGGGCSPSHTRQLLMQRAPPGTSAAAGLHLGGPRLASFESASHPGHYLTADPTSSQLLLQQRRAAAAGQATQAFLLRPHAAAGGRAFTLEPLSQPGSTVQLAGGWRQLGVKPAASSAGAAFLLAPPAAPAYPPGSRLLHGRNRDYLLVPYGQIQEERYTAYFRFTD